MSFYSLSLSQDVPSHWHVCFYFCFRRCNRYFDNCVKYWDRCHDGCRRVLQRSPRPEGGNGAKGGTEDEVAEGGGQEAPEEGGLLGGDQSEYPDTQVASAPPVALSDLGPSTPVVGVVPKMSPGDHGTLFAGGTVLSPGSSYLGTHLMSKGSSRRRSLGSESDGSYRVERSVESDGLLELPSVASWQEADLRRSAQLYCREMWRFYQRNLDVDEVCDVMQQECATRGEEVGREVTEAAALADQTGMYDVLMSVARLGAPYLWAFVHTKLDKSMGLRSGE